MGARATSDRGFALALAAILLVAFVARVGAAGESGAILTGHPDANIYFNKAFVELVNGTDGMRPLPDGGTGLPLVLAAAFRGAGVGPGEPVGHAELDAAQRAKLSREPEWAGELERRHLAEAHPPATGTAVRIDYAVGVAFSLATVALAAVLARDVAGRGAALVAAGIVAVNPALVRASASGLTEPLFGLLVLGAVVSARRAGGHLVHAAVAGALMAAAYAVRFNGLLVAGAVAALAGIETGRARGPVRGALAALVVLVAAAVVAAPYAAWRADAYGNPFHLGQNGDVWADEFWGPGSYADPSGDHHGRYRTFDEYRENHTVGDAASRLWLSIAWQLRDFARQASLPVLALVAVAVAWTARGSRERLPRHAYVPLVALVTFAGFLWIYPLVASERYYHHLTPLIAAWGASALVAWAAADEAFALVAWAAGLVAAFAYGLRVLGAAPAGLAWLADGGPAVAVVALGAAAAGALAWAAWRAPRG